MSKTKDPVRYGARHSKLEIFVRVSDNYGKQKLLVSSQADIHFVYGLCNGSAAAAVRMYQQRFPNRPTPSRQTFVDVHLRLSEYGIRRPTSERSSIVSVPDEERVLQLIYENPGLSVRQIALMLNISKWTVWRILKREGLHPYHFRRVQDVREPDYAVRASFCSWLSGRIRRYPTFHKSVMWTDEATFTRAGITNHRNQHLWMQENPHAVRPSKFQHEFSVNVWAAMINDKLIGPIELPNTMNGQRLLEFLENQFRDVT